MSLKVVSALSSILLIAFLTPALRADELDDLCGTYHRPPVENDWHTGTISRKAGADGKLEWRNKAGVTWTLIPDLKTLVLHTDKTFTYFDDASRRDLAILYRGGKPVGFRMGEESYLREGVKILAQTGYGLHGYVTVGVEPPPKEFANGFGFYSTAFQLLDKPIGDFQAGLAGTWIIPENSDFKKPLCPPGTYARDHWPERGPTYSEVFQTIEGSLGFWGSTQFGSTAPKYRMNGTTDGYSHEISSPGWGFGVVEPASPETLSIAQLSNRLIVPPDGITFDGKTKHELMGIAWMALPLLPAEQDHGISTGDQSWTFFANAANFSGPVAFWIPEAWSRLSRNYKEINGRGLDARPGSIGSVGMEIAGMPCFEARDKKGVLYRRIPRLNFPANQRGQTVLTQDIAAYSKLALFDRVNKFHQNGRLAAGEFDAHGVFFNKLRIDKAAFDQSKDNTPITGIDSFVEEKLFGQSPSLAYGLKWSDAGTPGHFPEYFKEVKGKLTAIPATEVPQELGLAEQEFDPPATPRPYTSPEDAKSVWKAPGPKAGPFEATLSDGSQITYAWYRFIDQPTIVAQQWKPEKRDQLQKLVELMHKEWPIDGKYMAAPSSGSLVKIDPALVVNPPAGLEVGYVPIVTRQAVAGADASGPSKDATKPRRRPRAAKAEQ